MKQLSRGQFEANQRLEFERRERICDLLEEGYGHFIEDLAEEDRLAFRRVFDIICGERNVLAAQLRSPRALLEAYIEYLEGEASEAVVEMNVDIDDTVAAGGMPDVDSLEAGVQRMFQDVAVQRDALKRLPQESGENRKPRSNPFYHDEELPVAERMPREAATLNADNAVERFPWLTLRTGDEFIAFARSDAAAFLRDHDPWDTDEIREAKHEEYGVFLAWLIGASDTHPVPAEVMEAWQAWSQSHR